MADSRILYTEPAAWEWRPDRDRVVFSVTFLAVTGLAPTAVPRGARGAVSLVHPQDRRRVWNRFAEYLSRRSEDCDLEFRLRRVDGRYCWVQARTTGEWDGDGNLLRLVGSLTDVTARIEAVEERDRLYNLSRDLLAVVGYDLYIQQANPAWVRVLGWARDELDARPLLEFVHPEDAATTGQALLRLVAGETVEGLECRMMCRDGSHRWLSLNSSPYPDREVIFTVGRDITAQKYAEQQRLEFQERLRSLGNQLARVEDRHRRDLAVAIHDGLAQQLFAMHAQVTLLKYPERLEDQQEIVAEILAIIDQTMVQARNLSFELFPPVLYEVGLSAALDWLARYFAERTGIACNFIATGDEVEMADDTRAMAYQCTRELLTNVRKHAAAESARIEMACDAEEVQISVRDDGRGFDPSALEAGPAQDREGGFGLFSVRERLHSVAGSMRVVAAPGAGTTITLRMPLQSVDDQVQPPPEYHG